jgi:alcohol dehydrogenase
MKALVYDGPGRYSLEAKEKPTLRDGSDAIIRVTKTTLCGTDLHILKGDVPTVNPGRILGHEGVGVIEEIGSSVTRFHVGDPVIISCITTCGKCEPCRRGMCSHCTEGGWVLGNTLDGTQAEYVRTPWADTSLHFIPDGADHEAMVMLSDILPTGYECGVLSGAVKPGDNVVIVGAGPIGLAALLTAKFYAPAEIIIIDPDPHRLEVALRLGATEVINNGNKLTDPVACVMDLTFNHGADVVIEAVGIPETFALCQQILAPGGHLANVGVHGSPVELALDQLWSRNVTITTRLVDAVTTPLLQKTVLSGRIPAQDLITHRFPLEQIMEAYEVFSHAGAQQTLKVILFAGEDPAPPAEL